MFEEVPRERRGLARLSARRVVLGPFVVGGGVLLATLGGSVALAATVITASTIGLPATAGSHLRPLAIAASSSSHRAVPALPTSNPVTPRQSAELVAPLPSSPRPGPASTHSQLPTTPSTLLSSGQPGSLPAATPSASASASPTRPAGNAVVYIYGYSLRSKRLNFQYASVQSGAGAGGSDLYSVIDQQAFSAGLDPAVQVTPGQVLCPPPGGQCGSTELINAANRGYFAEVGIDPTGNLRSVIERDNTSAPVYGGSTSTPAPTPNAATSPPTAPAN